MRLPAGLCSARYPIRTRRTASTVVIATFLATTGSVGGCALEEAGARSYEVWAMDQGTHVIHIFNDALEEIATVDMASHGVQVPHMVEFTSDYRYAFVAAPATGNVAVIRTEDREVVAVLATGPRTHHAAVSPDDRRILVSVIGAPDVPWDGRLVEIEADYETRSFSIGRELVLTDDPLFRERRDGFMDSGGAVCLAFTADGRFGYLTLGPGLNEGGALVLDVEQFRFVEAYSPTEVEANCGTLLSHDGTHMFLVGGDNEVGVWHAMNTSTHQREHRAESRGHDAHGSWLTPDGREYWMVNRVTSNAIVIDTETLEVIHEIPFVGKTPDIVTITPDSRYALITLRGPNPVTMPHVAVGETPGFAVVDVATREVVEIVEPARGNEASDFHGIAVRLLQR